MAPNFKTSEVEQWNFQIERKLGLDPALTVGYLGLHGLHLTRSRDVNLFPSVLAQGTLHPAAPSPSWRHPGTDQVRRARIRLSAVLRSSIAEPIPCPQRRVYPGDETVQSKHPGAGVVHPVQGDRHGAGRHVGRYRQCRRRRQGGTGHPAAQPGARVECERYPEPFCALRRVGFELRQFHVQRRPEGGAPADGRSRPFRSFNLGSTSTSAPRAIRATTATISTTGRPWQAATRSSAPGSRTGICG